MDMTRFAGLVIMFIIVMAFCTSVRKKPSLGAGDICIIENLEGEFGVAKILRIDRQHIIIKVYANKFGARPSQLDLATLSMGNADSESMLTGIPQLRMDLQAFKEWRPDAIDSEGVSAEELAA